MATSGGTPFDQMYQELTPYVTRLARRLARGERDVAQDFAQEAWTALFFTPEELRQEPTYVRTIIFRAMVRYRAREASRCLVALGRCGGWRRRRKDDRTRRVSLRARHNVPRHVITVAVSPGGRQSRRA